MTTAWLERTVSRYYWNGKGYHTKGAVCRAIAAKEAVIWSATHFAALFPSCLPDVLAEVSQNRARALTALAFANIGSNRDRLIYGLTTFPRALSPWNRWITRRTTHLLAGDRPLIERVGDDEWNSWKITSVELAHLAGLPLSDNVRHGRKYEKPDSVHLVLSELYESRLPNDMFSDYEKYRTLRPLGMILHRLEERFKEESFGGST